MDPMEFEVKYHDGVMTKEEALNLLDNTIRERRQRFDILFPNIIYRSLMLSLPLPDEDDGLHDLLASDELLGCLDRKKRLDKKKVARLAQMQAKKYRKKDKAESEEPRITVHEILSFEFDARMALQEWETECDGHMSRPEVKKLNDGRSLIVEINHWMWALFRIQEQVDPLKINYIGGAKQEALVRWLKQLVDAGEIADVPPRAVARLFLINGREINKASFTSAKNQVKPADKKKIIKGKRTEKRKEDTTH